MGNFHFDTGHWYLADDKAAVQNLKNFDSDCYLAVEHSLNAEDIGDTGVAGDVDMSWDFEDECLVDSEDCCIFVGCSDCWVALN